MASSCRVARKLSSVVLFAYALATSPSDAGPRDPTPAPTPAQAPASSATLVIPRGYADDTPRGALHRFFTSARRVDYPAAATILDLSQLPEPDREAQGPILARQLKVVLDRSLWVDLERVSDQPEGVRDDGLPADAERIGAMQSRNGVVELVLRRETAVDGTRVWKFSPYLVERIPELYTEFGQGWLGDHVPERLQRMRILGLEAWQSLGLLVLIPVAWLLGWAASSGIARVARPIVKRTRTKLDDRLVTTMRRPLRWALAVATLAISVQALRLSITAAMWVDRVLLALAFVTSIILVGAVVEAFAQTTRERLEREGQKSGAGVVGVVNRIVKALLACIALIGILQALGFNVTGLLAGLGIGGLAVALAAQKTVENLIGGIMLMSDKPVKIGDFCRFGDKTGWVEDFGFRSTRIRTLERSVISIPNAEFANVQLENLSGRDRIRFFATINLRYETTADQMRAVLLELRSLFVGHPKVAADPLRVRFVGFGASSLDVEIQIYIMTADPNEFYAIREDLLLRMMEIVTGCGTGFAFPSHTMYMAKDSGLDEVKTRASEERIRGLRDASKLPFPDFTPKEADALSDRLDYPPEGSSSAVPPISAS